MSREVYTSHLDLIREVIGFVCRRHHFMGDEAEDFASEVHLRLIENDYRILGRFQGNSQLKTYLVTVVARLGMDYRRRKWGKWRPSMVARKLGEPAVRLETLCSRDGLGAAKAIDVMRAERPEVPVARLEEMAVQLPIRHRVQLVGEEALGAVAVEGNPEKRLIAGEAERRKMRVLALLEGCIAALEPEQRLILKLHFEHGLRWNQIARRVGLGQKQVYRAKNQALAQLRILMRREGVGRDEFAALGAEDAP